MENPCNRGKGYSVRTGLLHAQGEIVMFTDADLSAPIEEAERLFAAIAGGADIAIGSRWLGTSRQTHRQPMYRQIFGRCFNARHPHGDAPALCRHPVRLQSLHPRRRPNRLPAA